VSEFGFELSLCARLEAAGVPEFGGRDAVVARQLGAGVAAPGGRVLDVLAVEPGLDFEERAAITPECIPREAIEADLGPGRSRRVTEAFDVRPDRARAIAEHAAEIGFLELERRAGHLHARQVARYPDEWYGEIVGIENKPDLANPGALAEQLRIDVSLGVVDRVVLATESYVTGAHRNRIPDAVGIWRFEPEDGAVEVLRAAEPLPVTEPGVEVLDREPGRSSIEVVPPDAIARARRRIAERAYGKGWRTFSFPPCAEVDAAERDGASLPECRWKGRIVDAATECGEACPGFEPGSAPEVDPAAERDASSPWIAEPDGRQRRQAGLDRFG
jgi:hypothetical protein